MQSFYYSTIGVLSIIIHLVLNHEMFTKPKERDNTTIKYFHIYLITVLCYFITDTLWGFLDFLGNTRLLYIDTVFYYIFMSLTVVFCCRYIIAFLDLNKILGRILIVFGITFCVLEFTALIINLFVPIFFFFDETGTYHAAIYREIALITQVVMFAGITTISFIVSLKRASSDNKRIKTICLLGFVMTIAISLQAHFPMLPLYSIGLLIGTGILHVFIQESVKNEQYTVLSSLAAIFYSMHVLDLKRDTAEQFNAINEVKQLVNHKHGATQMMRTVMKNVTDSQYVDAALDFTDLTTLPDRMVNKKIISAEFVGKHIGWFLSSFITMEADENGRPTKVIHTSRIIDEEKRQKERLIQKTQTDEMTGLFNRRAYEEDIYAHNDIPEQNDFVYVSLDVNGLKVVNDTIGHAAGDELIIGACQCMKETLGSCGKLYRVGGDEFVAILLCSKETAAESLGALDKAIAAWKGELIDSISVSYGWVSREEMPEGSVRQLGAEAEKRMYEAKSEHYRKQGMDRRGQQDAHKALCDLYTKILKINVTDDTYQIVNMDEAEKTEEKGFADTISSWLKSFGTSGQVHPDDLENYLKLTDLTYIRQYFAGDKTSLHIFYRRKYGDGERNGDGFKQVLMEMIPAKDYSDENQSLFLYVKDIER